MLNWMVRNRTVWFFNCVYLKHAFTNHIFNVYVNTGFGIKSPTMADMPENQTEPNHHQMQFSVISRASFFGNI